MRNLQDIIILGVTTLERILDHDEINQILYADADDEDTHSLTLSISCGFEVLFGAILRANNEANDGKFSSSTSSSSKTCSSYFQAFFQKSAM